MSLLQEWISESFFIHMIYTLVSLTTGGLDAFVQHLVGLLTTSKPVRIRKIIHRRMIGGFDHANITQFISITIGRADLTQLYDDHFCLYYMTKRQAHFLRLPHAIHKYNCQSAPFQFHNCFNDAIQLYTVDVDKLLQFSCNWPYPKAESLIFLFSGGRCGSTLVAKMIQNATDNICVPSEPPVFDNLGFLARQHYLKTKELLAVAIQHLCRPSKLHDKIFIKFNVFGGTDFADLLKDLYPQAKFLYIYRDPLATVMSYHNAMFNLSSFYYLKLCLKCRLIFPLFEWLFALKPNQVSQAIVRSVFPPIRSDFDVSAIFWGDARLRYFDQQKRVDFQEFNFDQLVTDPKTIGKQLLVACGLDTKLIGNVLDTMCKDSQENTAISRLNVPRKTVKMPSQLQVDKVNRFIEEVERHRRS